MAHLRKIWRLFKEQATTSLRFRVLKLKAHQALNWEWIVFIFFTFIKAANRFFSVQYPWEQVPNRYHDDIINISSFYIDNYLVSNADYYKYLKVDNVGYVAHWRL